MIEFAHPWLFALLPLPFLVAWFTPAYKERKASVRVPYFPRLVDVSGEKPQSGAVLLSRNNVQKIIVGFAWLCLVTAMAKPEELGPPINIEKSARDLMIAVDLSGSMAVEDFETESGAQADRLTAVKHVLRGFAVRRESDRLGLILFGDAAYIQAPFTDDLEVWLSLLEKAQVGMAGQSTAFGDAIGLSITAFEQSQTENRVLIVLTDGNDTASKVPPVDAAKVAASNGIKIYAVAVGDPEAVGEEKVDLEALQEIAEATDGKSFEAKDLQELESVYREIDALEPQSYDSLSYRARTSLYHYPLGAFAVVYLVAFTFVSLRGRNRRHGGSHV